MKILMVNRVLFPRSAVERVMLRLATALEKQGHQIIWFVREDEDNIAMEESYAVPRRRPGEESSFRAMRRVVRDGDVAMCLDKLIEAVQPDLALVYSINRTLTWAVMDVLHHWAIPSYVISMDYTFLCPARTMTRDDMECRQCLRGGFLPCLMHRCMDGDWKRSLLGAAEAYYLRMTRRYSLPTRYLAPSAYHQRLLTNARFTATPVEEIGAPLPEEAFDRQERKKRGDYFLYVGTLSERKGIPTLLRALSQCVNNAPVMIVGNGRDEAALMTLCAELGHDRRVQFIGQVPGRSVRQLMAQCLCLVAPSACEEIGPWALLEAQALGKPAIVSDYGVLPERVEDGKTGYVFPAEDSLSLAQCLDQMAELDDEAYDAMCRAARTHARKHYHPDACAKRIMKIHRQAMAAIGVHIDEAESEN